MKLTTEKKTYTKEQIENEASLIVNNRIYDNTVDDMIRCIDPDRLDSFDQTGYYLLVDLEHGMEAVYFVVDEWLFNRLKADGEAVGELFGLRIWARVHNHGEAIKDDGVMKELAVEMLESKGVEPGVTEEKFVECIYSIPGFKIGNTYKATKRNGRWFVDTRTSEVLLNSKWFS